MPAKYRGKVPANPVQQAPLLSLKKPLEKRKNLTQSHTKNHINVLAQELQKLGMLKQGQKKIAQVTATLNIAPATAQATAQATAILVATQTIALVQNREIAPKAAPVIVIQAVTPTLAPQPVPAMAWETTMRV